MKKRKFVSYLRVSTDKQKKGYGVDVQRSTILEFLKNIPDSLIVEEFVEIETGRENERPNLLTAFETCQSHGATLIIAKLDRLSRNVAFISKLMESGTDFIACDFPEANKFTIHILAAIAEHERELISKRTKEALKAAKARGVLLGKPANLTLEGARKGTIQALHTRQRKADNFARKRYPYLQKLREEGFSYGGIAKRLNSEGILTPRGLEGKWHATSVRNLLKRVESESRNGNPRLDSEKSNLAKT